jgi:aldehyde dehydrogenase (NAD+)
MPSGLYVESEMRVLELEKLAPRDIVTAMTESSSETQKDWASRPVVERLAVLKRARPLFAARTSHLCAAISPELARNAADTRVAEILPLLEACRFLEHEAAGILAPKRLGRRGRPFWLSGVSSEIHRVPMGRVLVIAPSNYPLFLPGVQVLQALAAGNSVVWKPGRGGRAVALLFASILLEAGLPAGLLEVTDESVAAAQSAMAEGVDKVFFTGSAASGKAVMRQLAETLTPCVAELSGCDAVFVMPSADLSRVVKALAFGMRLNGSATCMAPRRVIVVGADAHRRKEFVGMLLTALDWVKGVTLSQNVQRELHILIEDAIEAGAHAHGELESAQQPIVLTGVTPAMLAAQTDIFAPVLAIMDARDATEAVALHEACPYALTASIFGDEREARNLAAKLTAGTVTINDLIVPTVDPRVPFGGRRSSGFGATRGAEGLLEMTAAKTISARRGKSTRHFDATIAAHEQLFDGVIASSHRARWSERIAGVTQIVSAARRFSRK